MTLPGTAFLALWNDRAEARGDYEAWHTREHIPERLSIPGILAGQRYVEGSGPLPSYFTLYPLAEIGVLTSEAYLALIDQPTKWSRSMRPAMSRFDRRGCTSRLSLGGGIGGCLAAVLLRREWLDATVDQTFGTVAEMPAFCALHLGHVTEVPALPFAAPTLAVAPDADAVLLVEGYDWASLAASLGNLDPLIARAGYTRLIEWTQYRLAYAIDRSDRETLLPMDAETLIRHSAGALRA